MIDKWEISDSGLATEGTEINTGTLVLPKYFVYAELYEFSVSTEEVVDKFNTITRNTTRETGLGFLTNPEMNFDQSTVGMSTQKSLETATVTLIRRAQRRGWL